MFRFQDHRGGRCSVQARSWSCRGCPTPLSHSWKNHATLVRIGAKSLGTALCRQLVSVSERCSTATNLGQFPQGAWSNPMLA